MIGEDPGGVLVEVSRSEHGVAAVAPRLAPDDVDEFAVDLESLHAELHLHPRVAVAPRPLDVRLFIKTGLRLDEDKDTLPFPRGGLPADSSQAGF